MLLYHKNILRFGCMYSVLRHGSETEFAVEFFRAKCNKNNCFPQGKWERRFSKTDLEKIGTLDVEIVMVELSYASEISLHSQINIIVYWDVWMWKTRCNTLCCCRIVRSMCAFWNLFRRIFVTLSELQNACLPLKMDSRMIIFLINKSRLCWMALLVELDHSPK